MFLLFTTLLLSLIIFSQFSSVWILQYVYFWCYLIIIQVIVPFQAVINMYSMNCTALSVANSSISNRRSYEAHEVTDAENAKEQMETVKFLKRLLKCRLAFLRAKSEEQASLMQSYSSENQSMLIELQYINAVQDFQTIVMKNLVRGRLSTIIYNSEMLYKLITTPSFDFKHLNLNLNSDITETFHSLRKDSFALHGLINKVTETEQKRDSIRVEHCKAIADVKTAVNKAEELNEADKAKAATYKKLADKVSKIRQMQFIMTNLVAQLRLESTESEKFDECCEVLQQVGPPRSWNYYKNKVLESRNNQELMEE